MTDTLAALLAAIIANPDEDTPRLMYADALDERGEPGDAERAEFVRVQCGVESNPGTRSPETLLLEHGDEYHDAWFHPIVPCLNPETRYRADAPQYAGVGLPVRGFIASVTCTAADWLTHGDAIRAAQPVTRVVWTVGDNATYLRIYELYEAKHGLRLDSANVPLSEVAADLWPGVAFELPPPPATVDDFNAITGQILNDIIQDFYR